MSCRVALELHVELETLNWGQSMRNSDNFMARDIFSSFGGRTGMTLTVN